MICKNCKKSNPQNANHCSYCGKSLNTSSNTLKNKRKNAQTERIIVALIIAMVLFLVAVVGVYIYNSGSKNDWKFQSGSSDRGSSIYP